MPTTENGDGVTPAHARWIRYNTGPLGGSAVRLINITEIETISTVNMYNRLHKIADIEKCHKSWDKALYTVGAEGVYLVIFFFDKVRQNSFIKEKGNDRNEA